VAFAVGVERGVEATVGRRHLSLHPGERLLGDATHLGVFGRLPEMDGQAAEQRVVVQHLLEVWHEPDRVDRIPVKATADLVVETASRHVPERLHDDVERPFLAGPAPEPKDEVERHRLRKFGRAAEAAVRLIILLSDAAERALQ
jgi:hypothetical protein